MSRHRTGPRLARATRRTELGGLAGPPGSPRDTDVRTPEGSTRYARSAPVTLSAARTNTASSFDAPEVRKLSSVGPLIVSGPIVSIVLSSRRLAGVLLVACLAAPAVADRIERRDGGVLVGRVVSMDLERIRVRTERGELVLARSEIVSIRFPSEVPPRKVELRNVRSDDA